MSLLQSPQNELHPSHPIDFAEARRAVEENGYVVFRNLVDKGQLARHTQQLFETFDRLNADGPLLSGGGGMIMGHLNCFPGEASRFVYDSLNALGVIDFVRSLWPKSVRMPNVGCNFNLPRSNPQNYHMDGYAESAFPIVNIASVDTNLVNGALDVLERTHRRAYKYHEIVLERPRSIRVLLQQGDVLIRSSMLWHRGMPNRSCRARPMLALTWENGGSDLDDPYSKHAGEIAFLSNRYETSVAGKFREYSYVLAPGVNAAARFALSLVKR